jgi:hypothetical protein
MRAFFAAVEQGLPVVRVADLAPPLAADEYAALRAAGILRDEDRAGVDEISVPDFARALRALYGVAGRGLPVPARFGRDPAHLGWIGEGNTERDVLLLTGPGLTLGYHLLRSRRTLFLLPTAHHLTDALRAKHGRDAYLSIDVLEESLAVHDGHLARAGVRAPSAPDLSSLSSAPPPPPLAPAPASRLIRGAKRWNQIRIALVNPTTVHIDFPGVSVRRTHIDLGMARKGNREPLREWALLVEVCENHGIFLGHQFGGADATKKLVSRLSKVLRAVFDLRESAFHPYRPREGWQACFQVSPHYRRGE